MTGLIDWLRSNSSVSGTLLSAAIAAAVAIVVFAWTQLLTAKRNRAQLLVPKLEQLYLLVNRLASENASICALAFRAIDGSDDARAQLKSMDELELYGHRTAKEIIMYIRLYFPRLGYIHQLMFAVQRELNNLLFEITAGKTPKMEDMLEASGMVAHLVKLMEAEIVNNRDALIRDRLWPRRYRPTTQKELDAVTPPPNVPLWEPAHVAERS